MSGISDSPCSRSEASGSTLDQLRVYSTCVCHQKKSDENQKNQCVELNEKVLGLRSFEVLGVKGWAVFGVIVVRPIRYRRLLTRLWARCACTASEK